MILTDKEIRILCNKNSNNCMIVPFSEESLQSESYDLSISNEIQILSKDVKCINLDDQSAIDDMYETKRIDSVGYIISPKEYILVTVNEKLCIPDNITAHIRPRTRFTRLGLLCSAQHCNSTYCGNLKLGLFNSTDFAIKIVPNLHIAQIVFEELQSIPSSEKQYKNKKNSAYQNENEFRGANFSDEFKENVDKMMNILLEGE